MKKVLYISLTVLFLVSCASSIEVRMDGITGERIVGKHLELNWHPLQLLIFLQVRSFLEEHLP